MLCYLFRFSYRTHVKTCDGLNRRLSYSPLCCYEENVKHTKDHPVSIYYDTETTQEGRVMSYSYCISFDPLLRNGDPKTYANVYIYRSIVMGFVELTEYQHLPDFLSKKVTADDLRIMRESCQNIVDGRILCMESHMFVEFCLLSRWLTEYFGEVAKINYALSAIQLV